MSEDNSKKNLLEINIGSIAMLHSKIKLSEELTHYLSRMEAELVIRYVPGSKAPIVNLVTCDGGDFIASGDDFRKIGGYRKFLGEILKTKERDSLSKEKMVIVANARQICTDQTAPSKILSDNHQKMVQCKLDMENVLANVVKIKLLPDDKVRSYLITISEDIDEIITTFIGRLMGSEKVSTDDKETALFAAKVPKWIYNRFIMKDWIKNEVENSNQLIFPRGNFLKGVSATYKEVLNDEFVISNEVIFKGSSFLLKLLSTKTVEEFFRIKETDASLLEALETEKSKFSWTLLDPDPAHLFSPRLQGKNPPSTISERSRSTGGKPNQLGQLRNELRNKLKSFNDHLSLIQHGIINITEPSDFWNSMGYSTNSWVVTPEKNFFHWMKEEDELLVNIQELMDPSVEGTVASILYLLTSKIDWYLKGSSLRALVSEVDLPAEDAPRVFARSITFADRNRDYNSRNYASLLSVARMSDSSLQEAHTFLGLKEKVVRPSQNRGAAKPLERSVRGLITRTKQMRDISKEVGDWISRNFTGKNDSLRVLAAELILASFEREEDVIHDNDSDDEDYDFDNESDN